MNTNHPLYKQAFLEYLRKGTPIEFSLKQARPTTHYIWRTRGDGKVRPSHAANNGKIFAWDDPPPTGHPGEDFGCRCTAEPYFPDVSEYFDITLQGVSDTGPAWTRFDYSWHYFFGEGKQVTLRETGNLEKVVAEYRRIAIDDPKRLPAQIADKARLKKKGTFSEPFDNSYPMRNIVYSLGDTTIEGKFTGLCQKVGNALLISGSIEFKLRDEFRDPLSIGSVLEKFGISPLIDEIISDAIANGIHDINNIGSRIRAKIGETVYRILRQYIMDRIEQILREIWRRRLPQLRENPLDSDSISRKDLREIPGSTYYPIVDDWRGSVDAKVSIIKKKSRFTK